MGVKIDDGKLLLSLRKIAAATAEQPRQEAADAVIVELTTSEVLQVWGQHLAKAYARPNDHEEFTQVITVAILQALRTLDDEQVDKIARPSSHLFYLGKTAVVQWIDSPAVTVAAAMSGMSRRYRQSRAAHHEFVQLHQREPSPAELVEFVNRRARETRTNPQKQGALVNEEDVTGEMLRPYSHDYIDGATGSLHPVDDEEFTARGELAVTVRRAGELCDQMYGTSQTPTTREAMGAWMDLVLEGEQPTPAVLARKLGITRAQGRVRIQQIQAVLDRLRDDPGPMNPVDN